MNDQVTFVSSIILNYLVEVTCILGRELTGMEHSSFKV
jgi:hypothetical protein